MPKGISESAYRKWSNGLAKVSASRQWEETMKANGLLPFTKVGDDFQNYVGGLMDEISTLSRDIGVIQ